ncbi:hypothetical protein F4604DRAFT_1925426 [Suillus subluteus]|nr:hypothetical protein F4604DRAFT_1925426 [Suillus subluteus]
MFFPPPLTPHLEKLPLENMEVLAIDRLSWIAEYDVEKHEWVTFGGLDSDASAYNQDGWRKLIKDQQTKDLIQSLLDNIGSSPGIPQPEQVRQGMNVLLKGEPGTGKRTFARAVCNMLKRPMFYIQVDDIPYNADVQPWAAKVASLAIKWNAVVTINRGDYLLKSKSPKNRKRINTVIQEFESSGCICLWPSVMTDKQHKPLRPFFSTIKFHTLDRAARCQRWLQVFGRDDLATTFSSSEHASVLTVRDTKTWAFLKEIEEISWYELDGADIKDFMNCARKSAGEQDPTPRHVKAALEVWGAPLPLRRKAAQFLAHSWNASTRLCE